jgi:hypothetical protein
MLVLAVICAALLLYLGLNPVFGGRASAADRADYAARSVNYKDGRFFYPEEYLLPGIKEDIPLSSNGVAPAQPLPQVEPQIPQDPAIDQLYVTWLGHSTLLIQMHGLNILMDPVFTQRASPVSFAGPQRYHPSPLSPNSCPPLISCCSPTITMTIWTWTPSVSWTAKRPALWFRWDLKTI